MIFEFDRNVPLKDAMLKIGSHAPDDNAEIERIIVNPDQSASVWVHYGVDNNALEQEFESGEKW